MGSVKIKIRKAIWRITGATVPNALGRGMGKTLSYAVNGIATYMKKGARQNEKNSVYHNLGYHWCRMSSARSVPKRFSMGRRSAVCSDWNRVCDRSVAKKYHLVPYLYWLGVACADNSVCIYFYWGRLYELEPLVFATDFGLYCNRFYLYVDKRQKHRA